MTTVPEIFENMNYGIVEEDFSLARAWLKNRQFGPFINGEWILHGDTLENVIDPSNANNLLAVVHSATEEDVNSAVASAITKCQKWSLENKCDVVAYMHKVAGLLDRHSLLFSQIDSLTRGVQLKDAREFDVPSMIKYFKYYSSSATMMAAAVQDFQPWPVTVGIMSANTPLIALAWIFAPALAAHSCVCLVVPSEAVLPAMLFANICVEASGYEGTFNILPGGQATINQIVTHKEVSNIICYGPSGVVRQIKQTAAGLGKTLTGLMSGRTPMLVFDTADVNSAVESAIQSAWYNQGDVPWSLKTLLVQESIYQKLVEKLKHRLQTFRVGNSCDKLADMGRPYSKNVVNLVDKVVDKARNNGIEVFQVPLPADLSPQEFFPPTVLIGGLAESNSLIDNEVSVPVISVLPFRTAKEAVDLANNSRYGLAASIWSESLALSLSVADKLQFGTVWINRHGLIDPSVPFNGWKESGIGSIGGPLAPDLASAFNNNPIKLIQDMIKPEEVTAAMRGDAVSKAYKLYYGGGYKNADGNSLKVYHVDSKPYACIAEANRKDVRNTIEAALPAQLRWASAGPAVRAQAIYNMDQGLRAQYEALKSHLDVVKYAVDSSSTICIKDILRNWAAICSTNSSSTMQPSIENTSVVVSREPLGIIGIAIDSHVASGDYLFPLISLVAGAICFGNAVVVVLDTPVPTPGLELLKAIVGATPPGIVNVLTGNMETLIGTLAQHQAVDAIWYPGCVASTIKIIETAASQDMKRLWFGFDSFSVAIRLNATQTKAVWMTKGEGVC